MTEVKFQWLPVNGKRIYVDKSYKQRVSAQLLLVVIDGCALSNGRGGGDGVVDGNGEDGDSSVYLAACYRLDCEPATAKKMLKNTTGSNKRPSRQRQRQRRRRRGQIVHDSGSGARGRAKSARRPSPSS